MLRPGIDTERLGAPGSSAIADRVGWDPASLGIIGAGAAKPAGLSLRMSAPGLFRIELRAEDGRALMGFGPFAEDEIVAAWRTLSAASGLPFVVATEEAVVEPAEQRSTPGQPSVERRERLAVLAARRPRFLTRRRTGRLPRHPHVHRAHELAGGSER